MTTIKHLWASIDQAAWHAALDRYWDFVRPENKALELSLDNLDLNRVAAMESRAWYDFLETQYFVWKYTAKNWLATTARQLRRYLADNDLPSLDLIRRRLLTFDTNNILSLPKSISGNISDEVRRESAVRSGPSVGSAERAANPCPRTDAFGLRCNSRRRRIGFGAGGLRPRSRRDPGIPCGSSRSVSPHVRSARVRGANGRSRMPIAARRRSNGVTIDASRSRIR